MIVGLWLTVVSFVYLKNSFIADLFGGWALDSAGNVMNGEVLLFLIDYHLSNHVNRYHGDGQYHNYRPAGNAKRRKAREKPRRRDESIVSKAMMAQILTMGLWLTERSTAKHISDPGKNRYRDQRCIHDHKLNENDQEKYFQKSLVLIRKS